jgi:hypothetical protein
MALALNDEDYEIGVALLNTFMLYVDWGDRPVHILNR